MTLVLDALTHATPDGRWFQTSHDASEERLLREMDAAGVSRAVVVALAGSISNDYTAALAARHPDRLVAGASFDPAAYATPEEAVRGVRSELRDTPHRILKLHPRLNRYDPLDRRCLAVLGELASWPRPPGVWLCSLFHSRHLRLTKPPVESVHHLVTSFPLPFVICHGGGSWILQLAEAIRDCENAFLDLSHTLVRYQGTGVDAAIRHLVQSFDRRLLFGSDFPEISIRQAVDLFTTLTVGLPGQKVANVLGGNLLRLLQDLGLP